MNMAMHPYELMPFIVQLRATNPESKTSHVSVYEHYGYEQALPGQNCYVSDRMNVTAKKRSVQHPDVV